MKIKSTLFVVAASLVMCSQSYAGDLLDRMLGMGGCGCAPACCAAPVAGPGCGSDATFANDCCDPCARPRLVDFRFRMNWGGGHRHGLFNRGDHCCDTGCGAPVMAAPTCGTNAVAVAPACGCDAAPACCDPCCRPSLNLLGRLGGLRARMACRPRLFNGCCDPCGTSCCGPTMAPACGTDAPAQPVPHTDANGN